MFKVGQKVRVKPWKEINRILSTHMPVNTEYYFCFAYNIMRYECGKQFTIKDIRSYSNGNYYFLQEITAVWHETWLTPTKFISTTNRPKKSITSFKGL